MCVCMCVCLYRVCPSSTFSKLPLDDDSGKTLTHAQQDRRTVPLRSERGVQTASDKNQNGTSGDGPISLSVALVVCSRWDGNVCQDTDVIGSARMQAKWARHTARFQNRTILSNAAYRHIIGGEAYSSAVDFSNHLSCPDSAENTLGKPTKIQYFVLAPERSLLTLKSFHCFVTWADCTCGNVKIPDSPKRSI